MCDLRRCSRPAVYSLDNCRVCKQHVDLAFAARVPSSRSLRRFFPWVWKLTPELLNEFYDQSGAGWEEMYGDGGEQRVPPAQS